MSGNHWSWGTIAVDHWLLEVAEVAKKKKKKKKKGIYTAIKLFVIALVGVTSLCGWCKSGVGELQASTTSFLKVLDASLNTADLNG